MRLALSSLVLAAAFVAACSSGSSSTGGGGGGTGGTVDAGGVGVPSDIGGTQATCAGLSGASTTASQACVDCQVANCKALIQAQVGSDPKVYGGACQGFYACLCACPAADAGTCAFGCLGTASQACKDATSAVKSCRDTKCATACSRDGG